MTQSRTPPQPPRPATSLMRRPWRAGPFSLLFAFTPLWVGMYAYSQLQGSVGSPMNTDTSGPFGIPQGVLFNGLVMVWMLIGVYVLWRTRSQLVPGLVYLIFTIPATIALLFGPAIVLILQNLV